MCPRKRYAAITAHGVLASRSLASQSRRPRRSCCCCLQQQGPLLLRCGLIYRGGGSIISGIPPCTQVKNDPLTPPRDVWNGRPKLSSQGAVIRFAGLASLLQKQEYHWERAKSGAKYTASTYMPTVGSKHHPCCGRRFCGGCARNRWLMRRSLITGPCALLWYA